MTTPAIKKTTNWTEYAVRCACVKNELYTEGDVEDYSNMLDMVAENLHPTDADLYRVALDISEHSTDQPVSNVMYILANEAITYTFTLDGRDDI